MLMTASRPPTLLRPTATHGAAAPRHRRHHDAHRLLRRRSCRRAAYAHRLRVRLVQPSAQKINENNRRRALPATNAMAMAALPCPSTSAYGDIVASDVWWRWWAAMCVVGRVWEGEVNLFMFE